MSCIIPDFNENAPRNSLVSILLDIFLGGKIGTFYNVKKLSIYSYFIEFIF